MANSGRVAPRDFPPCFLHPQYHEQFGPETFAAIPTRKMEDHASTAPGHILTNIHLAQAPAERRFIVEVVLEKGRFFIESPCTFTPSLGIDFLDANLAHDAEEWILVQQLRMKPRRLAMIFGSNDRLSSSDYIRIVSAPHAGDRFQDIPVEFESIENTKTAQPILEKGAAKKSWWKFW